MGLDTGPSFWQKLPSNFCKRDGFSNRSRELWVASVGINLAIIFHLLQKNMIDFFLLFGALDLEMNEALRFLLTYLNGFQFVSLVVVGVVVVSALVLLFVFWWCLRMFFKTCSGDFSLTLHLVSDWFPGKYVFLFPNVKAIRSQNCFSKVFKVRIGSQASKQNFLNGRHKVIVQSHLEQIQICFNNFHLTVLSGIIWHDNKIINWSPKSNPKRYTHRCLSHVKMSTATFP